MSVFFHNDPVKDADAYHRATRDTRPVIGYCSECNSELHGQDDKYEADDVYLFENGDTVCSDCLRTYCNRHFRI